MNILVVDNHDSFVYNISHYLKNLDVGIVHVIKNNNFELDLIKNYDKIVLSPGPGLPKDAGQMPQLIKECANTKSILGVCLGHQAIAECFGGLLQNLETPLHGIASPIEVTANDYLFKNIPDKFKVGHYHSWVVKIELPPDLQILAKDAFGNIMALKHTRFDLRGVQFHPESILTEHGYQLLENWVKQ